MLNKMLIYPLILIASLLFYQYGRGIWHPIALTLMDKKTLELVINTYSKPTQKALSPLFTNAGISYPPKQLALIAFKDTKTLELWASNDSTHFTLLTSYPILAASGVLGPKTREGDRQVPEGIYKITDFNPNSAYHLSMKINYPNAFDLKHAKEEGRHEPGSNIFIHGRAVSIGCLAMGDETIETLFSLVYATGLDNTTVLISPTDPSKNKLIVPKKAPAWTNELYHRIENFYKSINSNYT